MTSIFAAIFAALLLTTQAFAGALSGIRGEDDRVLVDSQAYPWSAIGRVNREIGGHCTGTLIAPRKVLTAAHCLWNRRTGHWLNADSLHFLAGYRRGSYLHHSQVTAVQLPQDAAKPPLLRQDWAVLILADDPGAEFGTVPLATIDRSGSVKPGPTYLRAGYSQDKPHILTVHRDCRILALAQIADLILHDCDATHGDSGSPILSRSGKRDYRVVGLHIGTHRDGGIAVPAETVIAGLNHRRGKEP